MLKQCCVFAAVVVAPVASADVLITVYAGGTPTTTTHSSGSSPSIDVTGATKVWVRSTGSPEDLGLLTFTGTAPSESFDLLIRQSDVFPTDPRQNLLNPALDDWAGLTASDAILSKVRLAAAISGDLTGSVKALQVFRLQIGHQLLAPVTSTGADDWESAGAEDKSIGVIRVGYSVESAGEIAGWWH